MFFLIVPAFLSLLFLIYKALPWLYDYRFTSSGIEFFLFKFIRIYFLDIKRIENVSLINTSMFAGNIRNYFIFSVGNRIRKKILLVKFQKSKGSMILTPANPEEAFRVLWKN